MNPHLLHPSPDSWDPGAPHDWCLRLARTHYENFPVASFFLPRRLRPHVAAIYAFARIADDIADEPGLTTDERYRLLDQWAARLSTASDPAHPAFAALHRTMREHDLPVRLFEDLLSAFRQDIGTGRYESFQHVLDYCRRSANPIGRLMLRLAGETDEDAMRASDAICTALQLTNFWQDYAQDLARGRVYLPLDEARAFGVDVERPGQDADAFRRLMEHQVDRTRSLFFDGKRLLRRSIPGLTIQLRATWHGGMRVLEKIAGSGYTVYSVRPRLGAWDAGLIAGRMLMNA